MCIVIGVIFGIATGFFALSALFVPAFASKPDMSTVIEKFGDTKDSAGKRRVLIAYNTKNGGSVDIGLKIREVLMDNGYIVDLRYIPRIFNDDISGYDAYIVGGAIYWSMFMRETREFLAKNTEIFKQKPTAMYMVCGKMCNEFAPKLEGDEAKWRELSLNYLEPMFATMPELKPSLVDIGTFAGNIYFKFMNLPEFMLMGLQMFRTGLKQGTYVNLDKVSQWAKKMASELAQ
jgi:menaquinone-dependent protoporphyrinogen oxidase